MIMVFGVGAEDTFVPEFEAGRFCYGGPDLLYLVSASPWLHEARVVLEAWDAQPPPDAEAELTETTEVSLRQGRLYVSMMGEFPVSPELPVGPGGRYRVRVDVHGRAELRRRDSDPDRPDILHCIEQFFVRFWPAEPSAI